MDLDLPFTLDPSLGGPPAPPAPVAPPPGSRPGPGASTAAAPVGPGPSTPAVPPAGPGHEPGPSTAAAPTPPPNSSSRPVPPSPPRNGSVVAHGDDPTELNLGRFGPPTGPTSSKIQQAGPAVAAAVPAQATGRGESPWALPPQRLSTGADEPDRATGPATAPVRGPDHPQAPTTAGGTPHPAPAGPPSLPPTALPPVAGPGGFRATPGDAGRDDPEPGRPEPGGPTPPGQPEQPAPGLSLPEQPAPGYPTPGQRPGPEQPAAGPSQPPGQQAGPQQAAGQSAPGPQPAEQPGPGQQVTGGWYRPSWPEPSTSGGTPPASPSAPVYPDPLAPVSYPEMGWSPESGIAPTAEDFARRRQIRPAEPVATMGVRAMVNRIGLVKLPPGQHEQEVKRDIEMVRRNFGGLRQVTVVNPKGGAGKTVAILLLAMTFGQKRGGYVLAWDNNETQGTLGMRAQQDFHSRTVRDMLRDLGQFQGPHGRIGDLSQYVRSQGEGMFDVLASDESATGGEMLTAAAFAEIREVVSRFYKLIFVDTGNNVRAQNWQAAMDATDQLVVTMSARNDSAETAARMLDHLEQSGRHRLVRQAVTVVSMPPSRKEIDLPAIQEHFAARTRAVLLAPYERLIDTGEPIRYGGLSSATRDAWLKIAAAVAEGL
ncbi:chromosome partitioning protein [Micromonospora sp. WMMD708]|uniref:chromosome partitioning protein n=1 Tax=Micromonospora sp. WMMD708 TaxID=3403464 RepID=UPI003BF54D72